MTPPTHHAAAPFPGGISAGRALGWPAVGPQVEDPQENTTSVALSGGGAVDYRRRGHGWNHLALRVVRSGPHPVTGRATMMSLRRLHSQTPDVARDVAGRARSGAVEC